MPKLENKLNWEKIKSITISILNHSLTGVAVGFLLTGVIGTVLSDYYSNKQFEREKFIEITNARRSAIQNFASLIYLRLSKADMVVSSLRRSAPIEELKDRKKLYDDAYVNWNSNLQANLFLIRSVIETKGYSDFEGHVEFRLTPILSKVDSCLTQAYDQKLRNMDSKKILDSCKIRDILILSQDCSYAITDGLFKIAAPIEPLPAGQLTKLLESENAEVIKQCPSTNPS
jgi:hypothetical protein